MRIIKICLTALTLLLAQQNIGQESKTKDVFDIARSGTVEELMNLEKNNYDILNQVSPMGFNPLILACYKGNNDVATYLIKKVKDINYKSSNGTALAAATVKGNLLLVKKLLESAANPNIPDSNGVTPLIYAIQFKNIEMIKLLLAFNADKYNT